MPRRVIAVMVVAVLVLGVLWVPLSVRQADRLPSDSVVGPSGPHDSPESQLEPIAILASSLEAEWGTEAGYEPGDKIPAGLLRLKSGLAQVTLNTGANIVLEGPAEFELLSTKHTACRCGKLRAWVPPQARGFVVRSPEVELVDLGAEFGMEVKPAGQTDVHVFDGNVRLVNDKKAAQEELTAGKSVRIDRSGMIHPISSDAEVFVSQVEMDRRVEEATKRRRRRWQDWTKSLATDRRVVAFYGFEPTNDKPDVLTGVSPVKEGLNGKIQGCKWSVGPWPEKHALYFSELDSCVSINVPGEFETLTLVARVWIDSLQYPLNALLINNVHEPGFLRWQILDTGRLRLTLRVENELDKHFTSPVLIKPWHLKRWIHLVTTIDTKNQQVRHFINARLAHEEPLTEGIKLKIGPSEIGNWAVGRKATVSDRDAPYLRRAFDGRFAELIIYSTTLSLEEIYQTCTFGQP